MGSNKNARTSHQAQRWVDRIAFSQSGNNVSRILAHTPGRGAQRSLLTSQDTIFFFFFFFGNLTLKSEEEGGARHLFCSVLRQKHHSKKARGMGFDVAVWGHSMNVIVIVIGQFSLFSFFLFSFFWKFFKDP